jgi:hypothetical protein
MKIKKTNIIKNSRKNLSESKMQNLRPSYYTMVVIIESKLNKIMKFNYWKTHCWRKETKKKEI